MNDDLIRAWFGEEFLGFWRRVQPYTMVSEERGYATYKACRHVCLHCIPGDFVECGVYRGGMAMLAALTFDRYSRESRQIHLFDTFAGMTQPTDIDQDRQGASAAEQLAADPTMCLAELTDVQAAVRSLEYRGGQVRFIKGDVLDTLRSTGHLPDRIAVLRLDTDWYESTRMELEKLYPLVSRHGVVLVDDYGHWLGSRRATDEFVAANASPPIYIARTDSTGIEFVKP